MEVDFYATTDTAFATFLILSDFIIVDFCVPLENKPSRKMFFFEYKDGLYDHKRKFYNRQDRVSILEYETAKRQVLAILKNVKAMDELGEVRIATF